MGDAHHDGFQCRVTTYAGFERDVLSLRNTNREVAQSTDYLAWRYADRGCADAPQIYWLDSARGAPVGMASLVPRKYWVDGHASSVGVLGDISLDATQRGKGLGKLLLEFMTRQIGRDAKLPWCLVIPTPAARHALRSAGWVEGGSLVRRALLLDPREIVARKLRSDVLSRSLARGYQAMLRGFLRLGVDGRSELAIGETFGSEFDEFWRAFPKRGLGIADHSAATLEWRYAAHPQKRFRVAASRGAAGMRGYLIFECSAGVCSIYDVLAQSPAALKGMLAPFILRMMSDRHTSISVTLSDAHPYQTTFARLGFVVREQSVFQVHGSPVHAETRAPVWMLTQGDKDV